MTVVVLPVIVSMRYWQYTRAINLSNFKMEVNKKDCSCGMAGKTAGGIWACLDLLVTFCVATKSKKHYNPDTTECLDFLHPIISPF